MKVEVKKLDNTKRELKIEEEGDRIHNKFEEIFSRVAKEAKVKGFRPGHIPRDILEKNYSSYVQEQVLEELIPEIYNQAIEKEGLEVIELPEISEIKLERKFLSFKATVSVKPEIALPNYKGLRVNYKKITVTEDEIARQLDAIKESHGLSQVDDLTARSLGYFSLGELKSAIEKQLYISKENQQRQQIEESIIEQITKKVEIKIPPSLIQRQLEELVKSAKINLAIRGLPKEEIEKHDAKLREELRPEAEKEVKNILILTEIAKKESIPEGENRIRKVMEFLLKEAQWQEVTS